MIIRPILPDDVYSVLAIEYGAFMQPYPPELMNYLYSHYRDTFLVAEMGSAIVGYVVAIPDELEIHIISIAVADGYRGQGVGSALMRGIMAIFDTGIPFSIRLEVRQLGDNTAGFRRCHPTPDTSLTDNESLPARFSTADR